MAVKDSEAIREMRVVIDQFINPENWSEDMKWIGDPTNNPRFLGSRLLAAFKRLEKEYDESK